MLKTEIPSILIYLVALYSLCTTDRAKSRKRRRRRDDRMGTQEGEIWNLNLNLVRYPGPSKR